MIAEQTPTGLILWNPSSAFEYCLPLPVQPRTSGCTTGFFFPGLTLLGKFCQLIALLSSFFPRPGSKLLFWERRSLDGSVKVFEIEIEIDQEIQFYLTLLPGRDNH